MKRFLMTCVALLMVAVLCCPMVFAAQPEGFYLEAMNAEIALPSRENHYVLYPNMPADSEDLGYLEMTPEDINELLAAGGASLDVLYYDFSREYVVYVAEDNMSAEMFNFSELSNLEREIVLAASTSMFEGTNVLLRDSFWVTLGDTVWMVLEYEVDGVVRCCRYNTICNGKSLTVDAMLYLAYDSSEAAIEEIRNTAAMMAGGTVFRTVDATPEGVGGITGSLITDVLGEVGMDSVDLTDMGLGTVDLNEVDLSGLDLDQLVGALGLSEEEAIGLVKGEIDPTQIDLSKADPMAVVNALGMEQDALVDVVLSALGFGGLDWRGILDSAGRGALMGLSGAAIVVLIIIVLLAVCGSKKRKAASVRFADEPRVSEEGQE